VTTPSTETHLAGRWAAIAWSQPVPADFLIPEHHYRLEGSGLGPAQRIRLNHLAVCFSCELFIHFERYLIAYLERHGERAMARLARDRFAAEERAHIEAFYRLLRAIRPDLYPGRSLRFLGWGRRDDLLVLATPTVSFFLLVIWGYGAFGIAEALGAIGVAERAAAGLGLALIFFASLGSFFVANAWKGAGLIEDEEVAEDLRERGQLYVCSYVWMAACGLLLIVLGLAGPGGFLSPVAALGGTLVLVAILVVAGIAAWRLSDELARTLSRETGNMTCYLILALGGGWAMLAHLGFVAAPAPLDWLTMFIVLLFAASFIVLGRRKLLTR